jgi:hypothetical protein
VSNVETGFRDLILRPTPLEPGHYETEDKFAFSVVRHENGRNYMMLWVSAGEGQKLAQPGDTVYENAFVSDHKVEYPPGGPVESTPIEVEPYPVGLLAAAPPKTKKAKAKKKAKK